MQLIYSGLHNGCTCKSGFFLCIFVIILFILPLIFHCSIECTTIQHWAIHYFFCNYVFFFFLSSIFFTSNTNFRGKFYATTFFYKEMQTENQLKFSTINCQGLGDMNKRRDVFNYLRRKELQCLFPTRQSLYFWWGKLYLNAVGI